jgi:hypothetical protein
MRSMSGMLQCGCAVRLSAHLACREVVGCLPVTL